MFASDVLSELDRISVIVPAYNEERYIGHCLKSLERQSYSNLEIIVVDDGSTDKTSELVRTAAEADSRIVLIRQINAGLSAARNAGIERATGNLVSFVDANDVVSPNHFESLRDLMRSQDADVSITNLTVFCDEAAFLDENDAQFGKATEYSALQAITEVFYQRAFDTCAPGKLYRIELWRGIRFPVGYIHEDLPTIYRVLLRARRVSFAESTSYGYRFSSNGLNRSQTTDDKIRVVPLLERQIEDLLSRYPELSAAADCFLVSLCFHLYLGGDRTSLSPEGSRYLERLIRSRRLGILRDNRARSKTRIACALSYLGFSVVRSAFSVLEGVGRQ